MLRSKLISSAVGILVFFSVQAHQAPNRTNNNERKSFVIIAAFNFHYNAKRYTEYIRGQDMNAGYAFNKERQLFYVYSLISKEDNKAKSLVWKLRENDDFNDAWVFRGRLDTTGEIAELIKIDLPLISDNVATANNNPASKGENPSEELINRSQKSPIASPSGNVATATNNREPKAKNTTEELLNPSKKIPAAPQSAAPGIKKVEVKKAPLIKEKYKLYVNTISAKKFKEVKGPIEIRDYKRNKKIKAVNSHQLFGVNDPKNGSYAIKVVSRIFGYRPADHVISLEQPVNDSTAAFVEQIGDSIIVHFDLERLRKGEIAVMWNVLFFKDAAIMRPESKGELKSLLAMLKENDRLKIKIHGHTNGNSHGKLLHLNLEDKDFFSLSGNHKEDVGSAKKLSEYRGYTIQHFLMDQGIDESRMEVVGWGGKKMMFDKHDAEARKNVRVEIEITDL